MRLRVVNINSDIAPKSFQNINFPFSLLYRS
jgi:hypothetical protein